MVLAIEWKRNITVPPNLCDSTYQPDNDSVVSHLGSSVQRCHPIIGSDMRLRPAVLHQVLDDLQVTFLTGQIKGCGTILCLGIDYTERDIKTIKKCSKIFYVMIHDVFALVLQHLL